MTEQHRRNRNAGIIDDSALPVTLAGMDNLQLWYRADSLDLNDDDSVSLWRDESGNNRHALQSVGADQPTFKVGIANNLPVLRFVNDNLEHVILDYNLSTYFVVWSRTNAGNNDVVLAHGGATYSYLQYGDSWYVASSELITVAMVADTFFLKSCVYDNVNYQRYTNGSAEALEAGNLNALYRYIGAGVGAVSGDIAEIAIFDINLSTANRQFVEAYLNNKYALW